MTKVLNIAISDSSFSTLVKAIRATVGNGIKKSFLSLFGFALILLLQVAFFSPEAIASPLAGLFGNKVDKLADTSKDFAKETGNRANDLAKNVKEGTKENIGKAKEVAKDAKDKIGDGIDKGKKMASDRTNEVKNATKDLPEKAGNKIDGAIDSVKNFLGQ